MEQEPPTLAEKYPVRTMAERSIYRNGEHVKQCLVLWYSWEDQEAW